MTTAGLNLGRKSLPIWLSSCTLLIYKNDYDSSKRLNRAHIYANFSHSFVSSIYHQSYIVPYVIKHLVQKGRFLLMKDSYLLIYKISFLQYYKKTLKIFCLCIRQLYAKILVIRITKYAFSFNYYFYNSFILILNILKYTLFVHRE